VLAKRFDPDALAEIRALEAAEDFANPRYEELLMREHYTRHALRMPLEEWPDPVMRAFKHANRHIYVLMQGPSEFGIGGRLADWDRTADIHRITVPTLVTVAEWDTMDPDHMRWMVEEIPNARALELPDGSHLSMYDDQDRYMDGLIRFIRDVDAGEFD
jgi:proline iminopeptidase